VTTDTIPASLVRAQGLTAAEYNDRRILQALRDRLRARGLPITCGPVLQVVAAAGGDPARDREKPLENPRKSRGDSALRTAPALRYLSARPATRRAGPAGGLEYRRGAFRGACWTPARFGALLRLPGIGPVAETSELLAVTIAPDALRPVAELFGFRAPARAVEALRALERRARRVTRRRREREATAGPGPTA
jgi:hypothetical protein